MGVLRTSGPKNEDGWFFDLRPSGPKIEDREVLRRWRFFENESSTMGGSSKMGFFEDGVRSSGSKARRTLSHLQFSEPENRRTPSSLFDFENRKCTPMFVLRPRSSQNPLNLHSSDPNIEEPPIFDLRREVWIEDRRRSYVFIWSKIAVCHNSAI